MHLRRLVPLCSAIALGAIFSGCSTSPISRIDANRAEYETWPLEIKQAVLDGRVEKGMTPKMVEVAIGKPSEVIDRPGARNSQVVWVYRRGGGGSLLPGNTSWGLGVGGVGVGGSGGGGGNVPAEEYEVVFEDGVVVESDYPAPGM